MRELPKSYSKGAKKAFAAFRKDYGAKDGERIFFQKADEQGVGRTLRSRVNSVFATGAKPSERKG